VAKEIILTLDKIQEKGISEPSRCNLCNTEAETKEHLLNNCVYTQSLCIETRRLFGKNKRNPGDIKQTIFQWHTEKFQCKVVWRAWELIVSFLIWLIWKERNRRIFQDKSKGSEAIWKRVVIFVREMILAEEWEADDWKTEQNEEQIIVRINLKYDMVHTKKVKGDSRNAQSSDKFKYPRDKFIKLNFDGALKGNPGNAGFGGIFRDSEKTIRWIFAEWGGAMKNNEAELWAVHQGLRTTIRNGYRNLEIEGDSQIVIDMLRKLNNGKNWEQIANSWRTAGIVQELEDLIRRIDYKFFNHVKRKGNQAVDFLANWRSKDRRNRIDNMWPMVIHNQEWEDLTRIINHDHEESTK